LEETFTIGPTAAWDMQKFWYNVTKAGEVKYGAMEMIKGKFVVQFCVE